MTLSRHHFTSLTIHMGSMPAQLHDGKVRERQTGKEFCHIVKMSFIGRLTKVKPSTPRLVRGIYIHSNNGAYHGKASLTNTSPPGNFR